MVERRPAPDPAPRPLEPHERLLVDARLGVHELADGMEARTRDGVDRLEALVQDPGGDPDERSAQPRAAGRADREREAFCVDGDARRHHALHPRARLERDAVQVDLAQHAVQVQVVAGQEVARAEPEARRQHARAAVAVDDSQVRRVPVDPVVVDRREQRQHAVGVVEVREASAAGPASPRPRRDRRACGTRVPAYETVTGSSQAGSYDSRSSRASAMPVDVQQRVCDRARGTTLAGPSAARISIAPARPGWASTSPLSSR